MFKCGRDVMIYFNISKPTGSSEESLDRSVLVQRRCVLIWTNYIDMGWFSEARRKPIAQPPNNLL